MTQIPNGLDGAWLVARLASRRLTPCTNIISSARAIGRQLGINHGTIRKWFKLAPPEPAIVVQLAAAANLMPDLEPPPPPWRDWDRVPCMREDLVTRPNTVMLGQRITFRLRSVDPRQQRSGRQELLPSERPSTVFSGHALSHQLSPEDAHAYYDSALVARHVTVGSSVHSDTPATGTPIGSGACRRAVAAWSGDPAVVVASPPGAGKTRLVVHLAEHRRAGLVVAVAAQTRTKPLDLAGRAAATGVTVALLGSRDSHRPVGLDAWATYLAGAGHLIRWRGVAPSRICKQA